MRLKGKVERLEAFTKERIERFVKGLSDERLEAIANGDINDRELERMLNEFQFTETN